MDWERVIGRKVGMDLVLDCLCVSEGGGVCECDHDQKTLKFYFGRADFFFPLLLLNSVSE